MPQDWRSFSEEKAVAEKVREAFGILPVNRSVKGREEQRTSEHPAYPTPVCHHQLTFASDSELEDLLAVPSQKRVVCSRELIFDGK